MEFLQVLGAAITFGSALGATVAGFFAYRQKSLVTVLRESNNDYKERVDQLIEEREELNKKIDFLTESVKRLEKEKQLPLDRLTKLVMSQNKQIASVATSLSEVAKYIKESGDKK